MINARYTGITEIAPTLEEIGGWPLYYLRLIDPQTNAKHLILLNVVESNDRYQRCEITEEQKTPLRECRYAYEVIGEAEETDDPQGPIIECGFFNFKDDREIDEIYK